MNYIYNLTHKRREFRTESSRWVSAGNRTLSSHGVMVTCEVHTLVFPVRVWVGQPFEN